MLQEKYIEHQLSLHPSSEARDIVKLCYQAAFGAEHLIEDSSAAKAYFDAEFDSAIPLCGNLVEEISDTTARVSIPVWKFLELPPEWLFNLFLASASKVREGRDEFIDYLECARRVSERGISSFSSEVFSEFVSEYLSNGIASLHHSDRYRRAENPSYRVIDSEYLPIIKILIEYSRSDRKLPYIIAIDGRAGAGKTTLANMIESALDAQVIRMDDFFLPPELRCEARFKIPGSNLHYERFIDEVIPSLRGGVEFSYRKFSCAKMDYDGEISVKPARIIVVEGSYSHHPEFNKYADLFVFKDVAKEEQRRRIIQRNGEMLYQKFRDLWIPLENEYIKAYNIIENSDIYLI